MILLPTQYLGSIEYYFLLFTNLETVIEKHETFSKQTTRNRAFIYTANGKFAISIPIKARSNHLKSKDIKICYDTRWQDIHWKAIESAYLKSAFFEYFKDDLILFYKEKKYDYLIDFNEAMQEIISTLIGFKNKLTYTNEYFHNSNLTLDFRKVFTVKTNESVIFESSIPHYFQVFQHKFGFISNLSILDLLFNLGNESLSYLSKLSTINTIQFYEKK